MKENWGREPYPPRYYEVLDRKIPPSQDTEWVWIAGTHPNMGVPVRGWTGAETFVERTVEEGGRIKYRMRFDNLAPDHPLYDTMKSRRRR